VRTAGHSRMHCSQAGMKWLLLLFFLSLFIVLEREKKRIFNIYSFCFLLNLSSLYIYIYLTEEKERTYKTERREKNTLKKTDGVTYVKFASINQTHAHAYGHKWLLGFVNIRCAYVLLNVCIDYLCLPVTIAQAKKDRTITSTLLTEKKRDLRSIDYIKSVKV
jgi:hypothetical protein